MKNLEANYPAKRNPSDPQTIEEFDLKARESKFCERASTIALQHAIDLPEAGKIFINMTWGLYFILDQDVRALTSDRSVIWTSGLLKNGASVILPLSPRCIFVAVRDRQTMTRIKALKNRLVRHVNDFVVSSAVRFV